MEIFSRSKILKSEIKMLMLSKGRTVLSRPEKPRYQGFKEKQELRELIVTQVIFFKKSP